jgi:hypothetical protein
MHNIAAALPWAAVAAQSGAEATKPPAGTVGHAPTVLYIAGSGRSGSTLLERVLGQLPGFVNVGELIDLFRRTASQGERCGCGEPFAACPFWASVGKEAFGGWGDGCLEAVHALQERTARQRHMPRLLAFRLAGHNFRNDVARYGACYSSLYRTIGDETGASCVVDASKWPVQALALSRAGIDIRVIHLVRDVRGVAYSLSKREVARPQAMEEPSMMWRSPAAAAALRWVACQVQAELLRCCGVRLTRLRYEDFVGEPRQAVGTALADLGLPQSASGLAPLNGRDVTLGPGHGLSGNPSRFRNGQITLRADESWRERMSRRDRAVVTAIGLPLLLRYGWRPRLRPSLGAQPR